MGKDQQKQELKDYLVLLEQHALRNIDSRIDSTRIGRSPGPTPQEEVTGAMLSIVIEEMVGAKKDHDHS